LGFLATAGGWLSYFLYRENKTVFVALQFHIKVILVVISILWSTFIIVAIAIGKFWLMAIPISVSEILLFGGFISIASMRPKNKFICIFGITGMVFMLVGVLHVCQTIGFVLVAYATHQLWHLDQAPTSMTTDGSFYKLPVKTTTLQTSASIAEFERKSKITSSEDKQDLPATVEHKPSTENAVVLETVIEEEYNEKPTQPQDGVIENRQVETI